jgi:hypothetical protein
MLLVLLHELVLLLVLWLLSVLGVLSLVEFAKLATDKGVEFWHHSFTPTQVFWPIFWGLGGMLFLFIASSIIGLSETLSPVFAKVVWILALIQTVLVAVYMVIVSVLCVARILRKSFMRVVSILLPHRST